MTVDVAPLVGVEELVGPGVGVLVGLGGGGSVGVSVGAGVGEGVAVGCVATEVLVPVAKAMLSMWGVAVI
jgi:hypothetical protein